MNEQQFVLINDMIGTLVFKLRDGMGKSLQESLQIVFNSETVKHLCNVRSGLYQNGSLYVYDLLIRELQFGRFPDDIFE